MGALALLAILMGATSGIGGVLMGVSFVVIGAGAWAALTGRTWVGRVGRKAGGVLAGVGFGLLLTGAVVGAATSSVPTEAREEPTVTATPATSPKEASSPAPAVVVGPETSPSPSPSSSPSPSPTPTTPEPAVPEVVESEPTTALAALALLEVRPRDAKTGYDRDLFGYRAVDLDRNGCDTRNDILGRDLTGVVFKPGTRDCVVMSGVLFDPYTANAVVFERGDGGNLVQIDHVVAMSDAWQKGAQHLDEDALHGLGNDPLNLLAVYARANSQKGDGDAATWLPANKAFRCAYVARQVAVKYAYGLWLAQAEKNAIERVLGGCPEEPLPTALTVPDVPTPSETIAPEPKPEPTPTPTAEPSPTPTSAPENVYYKNCTEARAAGVTPLYRGDPGYAKHLDRDGDGVACE